MERTREVREAEQLKRREEKEALALKQAEVRKLEAERSAQLAEKRAAGMIEDRGERCHITRWCW